MDKCIGCRGCKKAKKVNKKGGKAGNHPLPTHSSPLARLAKTPFFDMRLVCATLHNLPFMNNTNGVAHAHHGEHVDYHSYGMAHIGIVRIQAWV